MSRAALPADEPSNASAEGAELGKKERVQKVRFVGTAAKW